MTNNPNGSDDSWPASAAPSNPGPGTPNRTPNNRASSDSAPRHQASSAPAAITPVPESQRQNFNVYLTLGIVLGLFCNQLCLISIIFTILGKTDYDYGRKAAGDKKYWIGKLFIIGGASITLLIFLFALLLIALGLFVPTFTS